MMPYLYSSLPSGLDPYDPDSHEKLQEYYDVSSSRETSMPPSSSATNQTFTCDFCHLAFNEWEKFQEHIGSHTELSSTSSASPPDPKNAKTSISNVPQNPVAASTTKIRETKKVWCMEDSILDKLDQRCTLERGNNEKEVRSVPRKVRVEPKKNVEFPTNLDSDSFSKISKMEKGHGTYEKRLQPRRANTSTHRASFSVQNGQKSSSKTSESTPTSSRSVRITRKTPTTRDDPKVEIENEPTPKEVTPKSTRPVRNARKRTLVLIDESSGDETDPDEIYDPNKPEKSIWDVEESPKKSRKNSFPNQSVAKTEKPIKCEECDKTFKAKESLREHMRIHTGEKPYKCDACGEAFRCSSGLHSHKFYHHMQERVKCEKCGKDFKNQKLLDQHVAAMHVESKIFKCTICEKPFTDFHERNRHEKFHTDPKPYKCDLCGMKFKLETELNSHDLQHQQQVRCQECKKLMPDKEALERHMKTHPFKCKECTRSFAKPEHLKIHELSGHKNPKKKPKVLNDSSDEEENRPVRRIIID